MSAPPPPEQITFLKDKPKEDPQKRKKCLCLVIGLVVFLVLLLIAGAVLFVVLRRIRASKTEHRDASGLVWVDASTKNVSAIADKVMGGYEANGEQLGICRSKDPASPSSMPGKLSTSQGVCVISWLPDMVFTAHYQVLTNPDSVKLSWVADSYGHVPNNSWYGGHLSSGDSSESDYYLGRAKYEGGLQVGKINVNTQDLLIAYHVDYQNYWAARSESKSHPNYYFNMKNVYQTKVSQYEVLVVG